MISSATGPHTRSQLRPTVCIISISLAKLRAGTLHVDYVYDVDYYGRRGHRFSTKSHKTIVLFGRKAGCCARGSAQPVMGNG